MKIKISNLIIKVINREKMPKEVLFNGNIYKWCNGIGDYRKDGWGSCLMLRDVFDDFDRYGSFYNMLSDEVEIIEEPKKIKRLDIDFKKIDDEIVYLEFESKINELIDEINNLKEK